MAMLLSADQHNALAAAYDTAARDPSTPALQRAGYARKRGWYQSLAKAAATQQAAQDQPQAPESNPSPEPTYAQPTPKFPLP